MSTKQIQEIENQIKKNANTIDELNKTNSQLLAKRLKLAIELVKKQGLLNELDWSIERWSSDYHLVGTDTKGNFENRTGIFCLLSDEWSNYHYQIKLEPNVSARFDDHEISIVFEDTNFKDNLNLISRFVKDWGIELNLSNLNEQWEESKEKMKEIEEIFEVFGV